MPTSHVHAMSWFWIGAALVVPTVLGFLVALPFWLLKQGTGGNIAGGAVIMTGALMSVLREISSVTSTRIACVRDSIPCRFIPDEFTRYGIYAGIGFVEVAVLFMVGLWVEERRRRRRR